MGISTIMGLITAVGFIIYAVGRDIGMFIDLNSMLIVLGGTVGTVFIRYPAKMVTGLFPVLKKVFFYRMENPDEMIKKIVALSIEAKKNGILGLENITIEDPFLKKGVHLAIDGVEPVLIEAVLTIDINSNTERNEAGSGILVAAGDAAPAFGMIGTLIGLVMMLSDMDDPRGIGPAMALALLTTLYASLLANIFLLPLADKLKYFHDREMLIKRLVLNGILSIVNGDHPAVVQEKLGSFLDPETRKLLETSLKTRG